jgi:hypothetical protein
MEESNAPSWKQLFIEVLVETDKEKLTKLVHDTEGAILLRWKELAGASDHHVERSEIHKACDASAKQKLGAQHFNVQCRTLTS